MATNTVTPLLHGKGPAPPYDHDQKPAVIQTEAGSDAHLAELKEKDLKIKRRIRTLRIFQRTGAFIMSVAIAVLTAMTLQKYFTTRHARINGETAWPPRTVIWPALLLFTISATSLLLNFVIMSAYICCGVGGANKASTVATAFGVLVGIVHLVVWIITASLMKAANTGRDIWGWSCGGSDNLPPALQAVVDFNLLCKSNTGSFGLAWAAAGLEALGLVIYVFVFKRMSSKRRLKRAEEEAGRVQNF